MAGNVYLYKAVFFTVSIAHCSVILSGGPYCSNDGMPMLYATPDMDISINCDVDSEDGVLNIVIWTIPSFGTGVTVTNVLGSSGMSTVDGIVFSSTVESSNNAAATTNATLSFQPDSGLDEATVFCSNNDNPPGIKNCTLFILTTPSAPTFFNCTKITNDSLTLQWSEPADNGGEKELQYNITRSIGNSITYFVFINNTAEIESLVPNNTYNFSIRAGNSIGFGPATSVDCTTIENYSPPMFDNVMVCLGVSDVSPDCLAELIVIYSPCPLVTDDFIPEVTSYRVVVGGSGIPAEDNQSCDFSTSISSTDVSEFTVDVYANNSVSSSRTSFRNGGIFFASWIRDVRVTDVTTTSAVIQYTTADCVLSSDLIVELITLNSSNYVHHYENETISSFLLLSLTPNDVVSFTLEVTVSSTKLFGITSSFTVLPTSTSQGVLSSSSQSTTVTISSTAVQTPQCSSIEGSCATSGLSALVTAGISVAITVPVTAVITALMTVLVIKLCHHKKREVKSLKIATAAEPYETPVSVEGTGFEMKGNAAYGQISYQPATTYDTINNYSQ